ACASRGYGIGLNIRRAGTAPDDRFADFMILYMLRDMKKSRPGALLPAVGTVALPMRRRKPLCPLTASHWLHQCLRIVPMPEG
ncbi:hypothetical protein LJD47_31065, partial [Escherichia coli]|nr:hypothetical protein [Escherichia coli]